MSAIELETRSLATAPQPFLNKGMQRMCIWTGPVLIALWLVSWVFLARFIPPPAPSKTPQEIVEFYGERTGSIRLGMVLTVFASALLVPFAGVIAVQMKRIEGPRAVLANIQLVSAGALSIEFIVPIMFFQTIAFRLDEESARMMQMLNDMGWLIFVAVISTVIVQVLAIGLAAFIDRREVPIFPRWYGYLSLWVVLLLAPAGVTAFFKDGPFAWNGLLSFYVPLTSFVIWVGATTVVLLRAVARDSLDEAPVAR